MINDSHALGRRRFLQAGIAALGLSRVPTLGQAQEKARNSFGGFKLGIQSYTCREFDLQTTLKQMKELGLHYIELCSIVPKHATITTDPRKIEAVRKLCKDYDIAPVGWGVIGTFNKDTDANRKPFEYCRALGVKLITAISSPNGLDSLDKLCEEYQIAVGFVPHAPHGKSNKLDPFYNAEIFVKAVKDHHPLIGACLDTSQLIRFAQVGKKLDPAEQIRILGARNVGLHLKDHDNSKHEDVVLGKAALDVPGVLRALRDVKFQGLIAIEDEANPKDPFQDMQACVQVFKDSVKRLD
jgi:sugar phosphate isomerase/epimerase